MSAKASLKKFGKIYDDLFASVTHNHVFAYASQASFFVIISSFPLLMLVLNFLQLLMPISKGQLLAAATEFLPIQIHSLAKQMIGELYSNISLSFVSITTIFLIWSASRGVKAISYGLKMVDETPIDDGYIINTLWSLLYTVLFVIALIVSVVVLVFGKSLVEWGMNQWPTFQGTGDLIIALRYIVMLVYLTLLFMTAYKFLSKSKIPFKYHLWGAVFASCGWLLFSFIYSIYIANFSNFSYIYGSLAAVIFLMLWLWFCMIILLLGEQLNFWMYNKNYNMSNLIANIRKKRKKSK